MTDTPTPPPGREPGTGRFTKGNKAGKGNPLWRQRKALGDAIAGATDEHALREVLAKMRAMALSGDTTAASLVLAYSLGRPRERAPVLDLQLPALRTASDIGAAHREICRAAAAGECDLDAAAGLSGLVSAAGDAVVLEALEARLQKLEDHDASA